MISRIAFAQQIVVLGTSKREDQFSWPEWEITATDIPPGIVLHRPAVPAQNVTEIPAFGVVGVGYCRGADVEEATISAREAKVPPPPVTTRSAVKGRR